MDKILKTSEAVDLLQIMFDLCLKRKMDVLEKMGINETEYNFFMCIDKCNEMNIMQISNLLNLPQARISRMTDKFIKKLYIKRKAQKGDHRSVKLVLTPKGIEMHKYAVENKCIGETHIKNILKEEKYEEFKILLRKLIDNYSGTF